MKISFEGKRAIVTGAGHGFGRAIAKAFAENGAQVWACDVNADGLKETQKIIGKSCEIRTVNITDQPAVTSFVAEAAGKAAVDILVNNAGGVRGQVGRPIEEITPAAWQDSRPSKCSPPASPIGDPISPTRRPTRTSSGRPCTAWSPSS